MTQADDARARLGAGRAAARELIADLERDLDAIADTTAGGPDDEHDAEGSTVGYERARVTFLLSQAREQLSAIEQALADLGAGRYGRCERCGEAVGEERLRALPTARRCLRCASAR